MARVIDDRLRAVGMKVTPARSAMLAHMMKQKKPQTVETIVEYLGVDQATTYRNLRMLVEKGLVRRIELQHGHAHYEIAEDNTDHHHIACISCHRVEDFDGCNADALFSRALAQTKHFKKIVQHSLELFGLCVTCASRASKKEKTSS